MHTSALRSVHETPAKLPHDHTIYYANYKVSREKYRIVIGYSEIEMTEHFVIKTGFFNNAFSKLRGIRIRGDFVLFCGVRIFVGHLSLRFPRRGRDCQPQWFFLMSY